jgi:hypothetical protein
MNRISRPDMAPTNCQKCGCHIVYYNDGSNKPLAKCEGCGNSFRFDYEKAKEELNTCAAGCCGVAVFCVVVLWIRMIYVLCIRG